MQLVEIQGGACGHDRKSEAADRAIRRQAHRDGFINRFDGFYGVGGMGVLGGLSAMSESPPTSATLVSRVAWKSLKPSSSPTTATLEKPFEADLDCPLTEFSSSALVSALATCIHFETIVFGAQKCSQKYNNKNSKSRSRKSRQRGGDTDRREGSWSKVTKNSL